MTIEFLQVPAREVREGVVQFLWQQRHWPGSTIEQYYAMWDWRYSALSDGDPIVYVARHATSGAIVGHVAVYPRRFRLGQHEIRVGMPANLVIHNDYREKFVGPRMVCFPRSLAREGQFDVILSFANAAAHGAFMRLGFHDLGFLHTYVDIRATAPILRRRIKVAAAAGPLIDAAIAARRSVRQRGLASLARAFDVRRIYADEFEKLDTSHWTRIEDRIVPDDSPRYTANRYLTCHYMPRTMWGLFNKSDGRLTGYVVMEGTDRLKVWNCQVNHALLNEAKAIAVVIRSLSGIESVYVPTLPGTPLAEELVRTGFIAREPEDYIEKHSRLCAYWEQRHPLADKFAQNQLWHLWFGNNHY